MSAATSSRLPPAPGIAAASEATVIERRAVGVGLPANCACPSAAFAGKPAPTVSGLLPLVRLLQLASPTLPVSAAGKYSVL